MMQPVPVIIEDRGEDGVHWLLSFNGPNPEPEFVVEMKSKEDAEKAYELIMRIVPNFSEYAKEKEKSETNETRPLYCWAVLDSNPETAGVLNKINKMATAKSMDGEELLKKIILHGAIYIIAEEAKQIAEEAFTKKIK